MQYVRYLKKRIFNTFLETLIDIPNREITSVIKRKVLLKKMEG